MTPEEAALTQAGRRQDLSPTADQESAAESARNAVAARHPGVNQTGLLTALPAELTEYVALLHANEAFAPLNAEGWDVQLVDLARVCAIQPTVFTEQAVSRVEQVDKADLTSVAAITVPIPTPTPLDAQFDPARNAWVFASPNPNLRIAGQFGLQLQGGVPGFGFAIAIGTSFLQVAELDGRFLLRDGYHRAYGLLRRGVTRVPALVRAFPSYEALALPPGLLQQAAYLGDRPPVLTDYLDDDVSADVTLPATQKIIVVQGLEIGLSG
jgi:hypothetical protein